MSKPLALVDATELAPADRRDFIVQMALEGVFRIAWSDTVLMETMCAAHRMLRKRQGLSRRHDHWRVTDMMVQALTALPAGVAADEQQVRNYIQGMGQDKSLWGTGDSDDRHVIAAAVVCGADVIVSPDKRFDPAVCLVEHGVEVQKRDDFFGTALVAADVGQIRATLSVLAGRWKRPSPHTPEQVIGRMELELPHAMAAMIAAHGLSRADPPRAAP